MQFWKSKEIVVQILAKFGPYCLINSLWKGLFSLKYPF